MNNYEVIEIKRLLIAMYPWMANKWSSEKWDLFMVDVAKIDIVPEQARRVIEQYVRVNEYAKYPSLIKAFQNAIVNQANTLSPADGRSLFEKRCEMLGIGLEVPKAVAAAMCVAEYVHTCGELYGHLPPHFWDEARATLMIDGGMDGATADRWMLVKCSTFPRTVPATLTDKQITGMRMLKSRERIKTQLANDEVPPEAMRRVR